MTASTASPLTWMTDLSQEQIESVEFCAATSKQPHEEILAWLHEINWNQETIQNKLDLITSGAERFSSNWQSGRRKKKSRHAPDSANSSNHNSGSSQTKKRSNPKSPLHGPGSKSRKERRQNKDRQNESKVQGGRRSEKKRNKKQNHQNQPRVPLDLDGSLIQPIQSASGIVSGDSSYADRAKPPDAQHNPESQSSASTPSISSRTPPDKYLRVDVPAGGSSHTVSQPRGKSGRGRRGQKSSPVNDRGFRGNHDDSDRMYEPREQRTRAQYDRYNQYSHPDEVPPRHARRPARHLNGTTRNKHSNHHNTNGQTTAYRASGRGTRDRNGHEERDVYEDSKSLDVDESAKSFFKTNGSSDGFQRDFETKRAPPKYTLDLTVVPNDNTGIQEDDISSEKSDRSNTNIANSVRTVPAVTPRLPAFPFDFTAKFIPSSDENGDAVKPVFPPAEASAAIAVTCAASEDTTTVATVPRASQASGPTRPPIRRLVSGGVSGLGTVNEKAARMGVPKLGVFTVTDDATKQTIVFPQEVREEAKDVESDYQFGQPDDFGATENVVLFVGNLEARMLRGFEDEKFEGTFGIPHELISDVDLELKSGEELVALFSQFARLPQPPQAVSDHGTSPMSSQPPLHSSNGLDANINAIGTPTSSSHSTAGVDAGGTVAPSTEKGNMFGSDMWGRALLYGQPQTASAPMPGFGRHEPRAETGGRQSASFSNQPYDRKSPDSDSPEQYSTQFNSVTQADQPVPAVQTFSAATATQFGRMSSNGSAGYQSQSPNLAAAQMVNPAMFQHVQTGVVGSFGVNGTHAQHVMPPAAAMAPHVQHHQAQVPHLHSGHFSQTLAHPFQQVSHRQSHPMSGHIAHNGHPHGPHGNPMARQQFTMHVDDDNRYTHVSKQVVGMNFQAPAPPQPQRTHSGAFMHLPQGGLGIATPNPNPALQHLGGPGLAQFGGGMSHAPTGPHLGHGAPPMFAHPQPGPHPPMQPTPGHPPQHLINHNIGPQHPAMFDQQQPQYSEFVGPRPYSQPQWRQGGYETY